MSDWTVNDIPELDGKIALITGANSGIGYCTAKALAKKGCHVILACRSLYKSNKAREKLLTSTPDALLSTMELDLSDLENVRQKTIDLIKNYHRLDLLINNAGIMHPPKTFSAQGYEIQFAVNHLSHMLLTLRLLNLLEKTEDSRIITVTSGAQFFGKVHWTNLKADIYYNKWESYANSKLANVMFALELHKILEDRNIKSLAAHPGIARTNLFLSQKPKPNILEKSSLKIFSPFFQSAEMGSLPQLYAATSLKVKSGEHYGPKYNFRGPPKLSPTAPVACNKAERKKLWEISMNIIKSYL